MAKHSKHFIWNGFNYRWNRYPHRLSILGSQFNNLICQQHTLSAYHDFSVKIGNYPKDYAHYQIPYTSLHLPEVFLGSGRTPPLLIDTPVEHLFKQKFQIKVNLNDLLHIGNYTQSFKIGKRYELSVLLNGFYLQATNNRSGWHFGGLGIIIDNPQRIDSRTVSFDILVKCRPAQSPEPAPHGNKSPNNEPWTITQNCRYHLFVDYVIVAARPKKIHLLNKKITDTAEKSYSFLHQSKMADTLSMKKLPKAFIGIQGFDFLLNSHKGDDYKHGRYFRQLGAMINNMSLEQQLLQYQAHLIFSNTVLNENKLTAFPWNIEASMYLCRIACPETAIINYKTLDSKTLYALDNNIDTYNYTFSKKID